MAKTKKDKAGRAKAKKAKSLKPAELFALAKQHEQAKTDAAEVAARKKAVDEQIIAELLDNRKVRSVESAEFGGFTRITVTQGERLEYDSDGIYDELSLTERRHCFDRNINFNALPEKTRKALLKSIPKEELAAVTTVVLNVERMSQAVQDGKVDAKKIAKHAETKLNAPYVTVSHGTGS